MIEISTSVYLLLTLALKTFRVLPALFFYHNQALIGSTVGWQTRPEKQLIIVDYSVKGVISNK